MAANSELLNKLQTLKKTKRIDHDDAERKRILTFLNNDNLWRYAKFDAKFDDDGCNIVEEGKVYICIPWRDCTGYVNAQVHDQIAREYNLEYQYTRDREITCEGYVIIPKYTLLFIIK